MRRILPVVLLVLAVVGCGQFGKSSTVNTNQVTATPTPQPKVKVADFPALFGKSVAEIKKQINQKVSHETPEIVQFEIPQGYLNFDTRASVHKEMSFRLEDNASGNRLDLYAKTPQEIADFVGIDLSGKTPATDNDTYIGYDDKFGGQPVEITFTKGKTSSGTDKFTSVYVRSKK